MSHKTILTLAIATALGTSFVIPAIADSVAPAPSSIDQKSEIEQRKDAQAAKEEEQKMKEDAIEAQRQDDAAAKIEELKHSKTKMAEDIEASEKATRDVHEKVRQDIINNNKVNSQ